MTETTTPRRPRNRAGIPLVNTAEAAARLECSPEKVCRLAKRGALVPTRRGGPGGVGQGGALWFDPADVEMTVLDMQALRDMHAAGDWEGLRLVKRRGGPAAALIDGRWRI